MDRANYETMNKIDRILVDMEGLCEILSCGRRRAEYWGTLAKAEIRIGRARRWNVEKLKEYFYEEAM